MTSKSHSQSLFRKMAFPAQESAVSHCLHELNFNPQHEESQLRTR